MYCHTIIWSKESVLRNYDGNKVTCFLNAKHISAPEHVGDLMRIVLMHAKTKVDFPQIHLKWVLELSWSLLCLELYAMYTSTC